MPRGLLHSDLAQLLLSASRPHVGSDGVMQEGLVSSGPEPTPKPGHRQGQRIAAAQAPDEMAADAHRLGLYDVEPEETNDALAEARHRTAH